MTIETDNDNESPFPSQSDMDMDLWHASPSVHPGNFTRDVEGVAGATICTVYGAEHRDAERDSTARRIEQMGDVYEELRKLVDAYKALRRMVEAVLTDSQLDHPASGGTIRKALVYDVSQAEITLNDFVAPKPFPESV